MATRRRRRSRRGRRGATPRRRRSRPPPPARPSPPPLPPALFSPPPPLPPAPRGGYSPAAARAGAARRRRAEPTARAETFRRLLAAAAARARLAAGYSPPPPLAPAPLGGINRTVVTTTLTVDGSCVNFSAANAVGDVAELRLSEGQVSVNVSGCDETRRVRRLAEFSLALAVTLHTDDAMEVNATLAGLMALSAGEAHPQ